MRRVKVCVITGFGINADLELAEAFRLTGGAPAHLSVAHSCRVGQHGRAPAGQTQGRPR